MRTAQEYGLFQHVRFNTSVEEARWDDEACKWRTRVTTAGGSKTAEFSPEYTISSDFLISAVGQLNSPKWPEIESVESFAGKKMHSARWDWSYDLKDKKIAVLGNGRVSSHARVGILADPRRQAAPPLKSSLRSHKWQNISRSFNERQTG